MQSTASPLASADSVPVSTRRLPPRASVAPAPRTRNPRTEEQVDRERRLVARLLDNDAAAWREFSAEYSPVVLGCIRRVLSRFARVTNDHDVDEVYARFCCELLAKDRKKLRRFDPEKGSRLSTWLGLLATNATYDYLRRVKRDRVCDPMPESDSLRANGPSPYEQVALRERAELASDVLEGLSERDREFVELYFGEGLSPESVAETMNISVKTVYTKKHKITARLEHLMAQVAAA